MSAQTILPWTVFTGLVPFASGSNSGASSSSIVTGEIEGVSRLSKM